MKFFVAKKNLLWKQELKFFAFFKLLIGGQRTQVHVILEEHNGIHFQKLLEQSKKTKLFHLRFV